MFVNVLFVCILENKKFIFFIVLYWMKSIFISSSFNQIENSLMLIQKNCSIFSISLSRYFIQSCWSTKIRKAHWRPLSDVVISLPTFIIAECVLIYLDPESSRSIVGWAAKTFSTAMFFLYEQVLLFSMTQFCFYSFKGNGIWLGNDFLCT